jgi:putative transposase
MEVSAGGYYAWRKRLTKPPCPRRQSLKQLVSNCYFENRRRYGARRISKAIGKSGVRIGRSKVRRLMSEEGLKAICSKAFKPKTTDSKGTAAVPNLLTNIELTECAPAKIIIGDITYIRLRGGKFCYLAMWQDKVTRRIIGWSLAMERTQELVISALEKAIGSGNCYDNAQAESFFSRFKAELIEGGVFEDFDQARSEIFSYIEGYYNRVRLHSGLGYKSPLEFEMELKTKNGGGKDSFVSTSS